MKQRKKKKGFTLVELLIVIGISGILMAMAAPKYQGMVDKATQLEQRSYAREALNHIDMYYLEKSEKIGDEATLTSEATKIDNAELNKVLKNITFSPGSKIMDIREFAEKGTTLPVVVP